MYCRLAKHFSFEEVNDPESRAAAANGQFLMIRRDAYDAIGGHASVAGEVLEDVALAKTRQGCRTPDLVWPGQRNRADADVPIV